MKLVFASNNKHKIQEIKSLIPKHFQIVCLKEIGCFVEIPETADTIEANAILKANYITENYGFSCFADDSAIEVEALKGKPGVHSARYAGEDKNDQKNIDKLLSEMKNKTNRKAQFKTVIALNLNGKQHIFNGITKGKITTEQRGNNGFGYDSVFIPENYNQTFAEITLKEKNKISHRARAFKQLMDFLDSTVNVS